MTRFGDLAEHVQLPAAHNMIDQINAPILRLPNKRSMLEFQNISKYAGTSVHAVCCLNGDGIFARSGIVLTSAAASGKR